MRKTVLLVLVALLLVGLLGCSSDGKMTESQYINLFEDMIKEGVDYVAGINSALQKTPPDMDFVVKTADKIEKNYERMLSIEPPEKYQKVHEDMSKVFYLQAQGYRDFAKGYKENNPLLMTLGSEMLKQASALLNHTSNEFENMQ